MTVSCPDCRSVFRVDPAKVPATGVRARCSVCGGVIAIAGGTLPVSVTPSSLGAVSSTSAPMARSLQHTPPRPFVPVAAAPPAMSPSIMTPPAPTRLPSATPAFASAASATPLSVATTTPPVPLVAPTTTGTPTPRRSINPFLNADPGQRARRLARALVSDLVAYHPQKRDEGLRDGTLRQLFREDIKKSYEEYVDQVGRDVAENSPHFQEALNEILGSGRKLF